MNDQYLLSLQSRYSQDKVFRKKVNAIALILVEEISENDDIVRAADMAAIVALDFIERRKNAS